MDALSLIEAGIENVISVPNGAQPRHRVSARGGFARTYLPKKHPVHEYKRRIAEYTEDWQVYLLQVQYIENN